MSAGNNTGISAGAVQARALVVDDDLVTRRLIRNALERASCAVTEAGDGIEAQALLQQADFDVVVTDLRMPRLDGLSLMHWAAEHRPGAVWIIVSGVDSFDAAVEAVRLGAYEFLSKPPHPGQLQIIVRNALERRRLEQERRQLHDELAESHRILAEKLRELEASSEAMQRDLQRAEVIQRVLLPNQPPPLDGLCLHTLYRPGRFVGGDMYNVVRLSERHLAFYVADATGHGVSSAMLSVLFHRKLVLIDAAGTPLPPAQVLAAVNRSICAERMAPGLFLTAAYCLIDTARHSATIALAGHPPALLRREQGEVRSFQRTGPALGLTPDAVYRDEQFTVQAGDRLLLYTDGLMDNLPDADTARALMESLLASREQDGPEILARLAAGAHPDAADPEADRDDVTLLLLEAREGTSLFDNGASQSAAAASVSMSRNAVVFYGESESSSFFAVRGRGSWVNADSFHGAAAGLLDEGLDVVLDLHECEYLDSTFLGTIHELSSRAARGTFQLQNVPPSVRALFDELDMDRVLGSVRASAAALPSDMRPLAAIGEAAGPHARMLRAHETLAALSDRNREKFGSVVEALRTQGTH